MAWHSRYSRGRGDVRQCGGPGWEKEGCLESCLTISMDIKYNKGDTGYLRRTDRWKVFDVSHVRTLLTALRDFHTPGTPAYAWNPQPPCGCATPFCYSHLVVKFFHPTTYRWLQFTTPNMCPRKAYFEGQYRIAIDTYQRDKKQKGLQIAILLALTLPKALTYTRVIRATPATVVLVA